MFPLIILSSFIEFALKAKIFQAIGKLYQPSGSRGTVEGQRNCENQGVLERSPNSH